MSWLTPLGFLGLIGLIVWLIIYIIKPNYQKKFISSTYVWQRSLKFRKKRIPINKLRNILLIICQILTICGLSLVLVQPFVEKEKPEDNEKIVILDASADMLATVGSSGQTRFDRAVAQIQALVDETMEAGGRVSVILANNAPRFITQRANADTREQVQTDLLSLVDAANYQCTYGSANIDEAIRLSEEVLTENPHAEILLFSGISYTDCGKVTVVDVSDISEWNAAILQAEADVVENYYEFRIDLACYGRDASLDLSMEVYGVNEAKETYHFQENVLCTQEMGTVTLTFGNDAERATSEQNYILTDIYSYDYAYISIGQDDSLPYDNTLYIYGGTKPELKIQYASVLPNLFVNGALMGLRDAFSEFWEITVKTVGERETPMLEGYDVYIFEHVMPEILPKDGLVLLFNPDIVPEGADFYLGMTYNGMQELFLTPGEEPSPLMNGVDVSAISVTSFKEITMYDGGYVPLLYYEDKPIMIARNDDAGKIVVMSFNLHMSNLAVLKEFPIMLANMLELYIPPTLTEYMFEVHETVNMNARAPELSVKGPGVSMEFVEFPAQLYVTMPGVYTLTQTPISGNPVVEDFYVKIPAAESNVKAVVDALPNPYMDMAIEATDIDLVVYVAMAIIALLFCEWLLQLKEYF